jgi:hypothetical protein
MLCTSALSLTLPKRHLKKEKTFKDNVYELFDVHGFISSVLTFIVSEPGCKTKVKIPLKGFFSAAKAAPRRSPFLKGEKSFF